jgi:hypothetical protein
MVCFKYVNNVSCPELETPLMKYLNISIKKAKDVLIAYTHARAHVHTYTHTQIL